MTESRWRVEAHGCGFIDLRLAQMEAIDIKGLSVPEADGVHWTVSATYPRDQKLTLSNVMKSMISTRSCPRRRPSHTTRSTAGPCPGPGGDSA